MKKIAQIICTVAVIVMPMGCRTDGQSNSDDKNNNYVISGSFDDISAMDGQIIYLFNTDDRDNPIDSAVVKNGQFRFQGTVEEPWVAFCKELNYPIIVEAGNIVATIDSVGGTPLNDKFFAFNKSFDMSDIEASMEKYISLYYEAPNAQVRAQAEHVLDSLEALSNARVLEACWRLYRENGDNILGVGAMETISSVSDFSYSEFDSIVKAASPRVANSKKIQAKLAQLRAIDATSVGKHYTDIQGIDGKLSDLIDGKVALVDFYASWCGPCKNEIKDNLVPLWKKYKNKGLVIVGLNVWERGNAEERKAAHEKVMKGLGITYPQLVDSTRTATETYGVQYIPQIILIDKDGTILARDLRGNAIEEAIINALGK